MSAVQWTMRRLPVRVHNWMHDRSTTYRVIWNAGFPR